MRLPSCLRPSLLLLLLTLAWPARPAPVHFNQTRSAPPAPPDYGFCPVMVPLSEMLEKEARHREIVETLRRQQIETMSRLVLAHEKASTQWMVKEKKAAAEHQLKLQESYDSGYQSGTVFGCLISAMATNTLFVLAIYLGYVRRVRVPPPFQAQPPLPPAFFHMMQAGAAPAA